MPVYKFTMVFNSQGYGWTESYYLSLASPTSFATLFQNYGQPLCFLRTGILGTTANLNYLRISTYTIPFATQTYLLPNPAGEATVASAFPNQALLLRCFSSVPGPGKSVFLRGLPYTVCNGGVYTPSDIWNANFYSFRAFLTNTGQGQWGWIGVQTKATSPISGYVVNQTPPNQFQVLVTTTMPIFTNILDGKTHSIRFTGFNGKSELNGQQVVTAQSNTTVLTKDQFGVIPWTHGGTVTVTVKGFNLFNAIYPERLMTRKAGRQLFLERGRASVRAKT